LPRENSLVDQVSEILRPSGRAAARLQTPANYATVSFGGGRRGLLDLTEHRSRVWAEVLESVREARRPAYVEIDSQSSLITEVRLPRPYRVGRMTRVRDGFQIELIVSHARHSLSRSNPHFEELREALEEARKEGSEILVTETDRHEIIDARPLASTTTPRRRAPRQG